MRVFSYLAMIVGAVVAAFGIFAPGVDWTLVIIGLLLAASGLARNRSYYN